MTAFTESPWPGLSIGLVLLIAMVIGYYQTGRRVFLVGAVIALAIGLGMVYLEWIIETDREQITATIHRLADALENERDADVLAGIHSGSAALRSSAKAELDRYTFERVSVKNNLRVEPVGDQPDKFLARFNVVASMKEFPRPIPRYVELRFAKDGEVWRIDDYSHHPPQQGFMKKLD